jgi:hypothetical protein
MIKLTSKEEMQFFKKLNESVKPDKKSRVVIKNAPKKDPWLKSFEKNLEKNWK